MGTRKCRHNKGRKPFYKDHRAVCAHLLSHPKYPGFAGGRDGPSTTGNGWYDTRTWWTGREQFALKILCEADAPIEGAADALGRKPTSIAHRARDWGITLPLEWARLLAPRKRKRSLIVPRANLSYPFIAKPRPEHADLLAINEIVPKALPDQMRADVCQEIMIAILEGRTTLDALRAQKASAAYYIKKFWRDNHEDAGYAISFQSTDDDWNSDAVASSIAAKEWHAKQFADRSAANDTYRTFTPPVQFEAAWQDQVGRLQLKHQELGQFLNREEIEELYSDANLVEA